MTTGVLDGAGYRLISNISAREAGRVVDLADVSGITCVEVGEPGGATLVEHVEPVGHGSAQPAAHAPCTVDEFGQGERAVERVGAAGGDRDDVVVLGGDDEVGGVEAFVGERRRPVAAQVDPEVRQQLQRLHGGESAVGAHTGAAHAHGCAELAGVVLEERSHHHRTGAVVAADAEDRHR